MSYTRYLHLAIEGAKAPPSESQLCAIEDELGAKLPLSFKQYLDVANGGYLEYIIDVPTGTGQFEPLSFCGLFSADVGTFCDETFIGEIKSGREYTKIPNEVLPFARDGGGSIVYLDLSAAGNGRVVAFVEGLPSWASRSTESAFIQLASSFDEYVDKLKVDLDAVVDHLENDVAELSDIAAIEELLNIGSPHWRSNSVLVSAIQAARARLGGQV